MRRVIRGTVTHGHALSGEKGVPVLFHCFTQLLRTWNSLGPLEGSKSTHIFKYRLFSALLIQVRHGLVVRIAGSHPAGPGSIPGAGIDSQEPRDSSAEAGTWETHFNTPFGLQRPSSSGHSPATVAIHTLPAKFA